MNRASAIGREAAAEGQPLDLAIARAGETVSHNLNGQRLGRKGRETRERIVRAAIEALENENGEPFTLSAVARGASLGMSSLYNYFTDLSELMVAALEPVMGAASESYLALLGDYWPDSELNERCAQFWDSYAGFWRQHASVLHQRNRMSDAGDELMLACRVDAGQPLVRGIAEQLGSGDMAEPGYDARAMASVLGTMMERIITVQTQPNYRKYATASLDRGPNSLGAAGTRLLALAIRDWRTEAAS
ncbi:MAG: TetR/AcrR family transcriptional regulator [Novosphingobium sp.]|nr:TetR/AcrR family transcriptional regulator [Novosphingobium sp.]